MASPANIPPPPSGSIMTIPPPPSGSIVHLNGGHQAQPQQQQQPQPQQPEKITDNPSGEGLYRMIHPQSGQETAIPYSKVQTAKQQGYQFAGNARFNPWSLLPGSELGQKSRQTEEESRYNKDAIDAQSKRIAHQILSSPGGREMVEGDGLDLVLGGTKEALRTALGAKDIATKGIHKVTGQPAPANEPKSAVRQFAEEPNQNFGENMGAGLETGAEFMAGEGLLKGIAKIIGFAPKLTDAARIEQEIQKGTPLGKLALQALKTGGKEAATNAALAGGQTFVKTGGDTDEALGEGTLAGVMGGAGGVVSELGSAVGSNLSRAARTAGAPSTEQRALQAAYADTAQGAVKPHLEAINSTREPYSQLQIPHKTGPYEFEISQPVPQETVEGKMAQSAAKAPRHSFQEPQYVTSSAPTREVGGNEGSMGLDITTGRTPDPAHDVARGGGVMKTTDVNQAVRYRDGLQSALDEGGLSQSQASQIRGELDRINGQLREYRGLNVDYQRSSLPKIDVDETLGRIRTLSDASEELQAAADPVYKRIDDLTGGEFRKTKALMNQSENPTVRAGYQKKIEGMLNDLNASGQVSTEEFKAAKGAFHQMFVLDDISKSFDKSWMGNPGVAKIGNGYNGINGKQLLGSIRNARIKYGDIGLSEVLGSDRLTNLEEQAALNVTQTQRRAYGEGINKVLDYIGQKDPHLLYHFGAAGVGGAIGHATGVGFYGGAAAGIGIELGAKKLAEMMVADPKIGQNFAFAIRSGARPENYVPMIASMIRTASDQSAAQHQQKQEGGNE